MDRPAPTRFPPRGGPQTPGAPPVFNAPRIVLQLAGFIIACHVLLLVAPRDFKLWANWFGAVSPLRFLHGSQGIIGKAAPLVTHMLLHAGWMHLLMNSIWLIAFGAPVARRLGAEQRGVPQGEAVMRFLLLFILSGAVGALVYIGMHPRDPTILVGASGGVSGLLGGLVRFAFAERGRPAGAIAPLTSKPVIAWSVAIIALNLAVGLVGLGFVGQGGVAWEAHIGGYLLGLFAFPLFAPRLSSR